MPLLSSSFDILKNNYSVFQYVKGCFTQIYTKVMHLILSKQIRGLSQGEVGQILDDFGS